MNPAEWVTGIKEGYRTKTMQIGNCTVRVHRPILDDQERARREEEIRDYLRSLMRRNLI